MNIIILSLLISPIFFTFGWLAGRIDMKSVIKQAKALPKEIFDSIESLITNKGAKAAASLRVVVEHEPQILELQFILGKLYRNNGENDLAIRLHTDLLNSKYLLSNKDKETVWLELARDFQSAGLVDRSEALLLQLSNSELYAHTAQGLLLDIYQQDKNWVEAIKLAKQLASSDYTYSTEVAQFNCELAQEALIKSKIIDSQKYIGQALDLNRKCVRANILLGEIYFTTGEYILAIETLYLIEKQNYLYIPMVANQLFDAYVKTNQVKEALKLFKGYASLYPKINLYDFLYHKIAQYETHEQAINYLRSVLKIKPNAYIAAQLIEEHLKNSTDINNDAQNDGVVIKNLLQSYYQRLTNYKCGRCKFKTKTFFWQCPGCYEWESINPNNHEE